MFSTFVKYFELTYESAGYDSNKGSMMDPLLGYRFSMDFR